MLVLKDPFIFIIRGVCCLLNKQVELALPVRLCLSDFFFCFVLFVPFQSSNAAYNIMRDVAINFLLIKVEMK